MFPVSRQYRYGLDSANAQAATEWNILALAIFNPVTVPTSALHYCQDDDSQNDDSQDEY